MSAIKPIASLAFLFLLVTTSCNFLQSPTPPSAPPPSAPSLTRPAEAATMAPPILSTATEAPLPTPTLASAPEQRATEPAPPPTATTEPTATIPRGVDDRITFASGATGATLENSVVSGTRDRYRLWAQAGQTMRVNITSLEDNATFQVLGPDGALLKEGEATEWESQLSQTGDYAIVVGPTRGNATYRLEIEIPPPAPEATRISFEPGSVATSIGGELDAGERHAYVFRAVAEQNVSVYLSAPQEGPVLAIEGADGTIFLRESDSKAGRWIPALPRSQDYYVEVISTGAVTSYTLNVNASALSDLPQRIQFEEGGTSTTVSGEMRAGGDLQRYILRALAGQTIEVRALLDPSPLSLFLYSADGDVFFYDEEGLLRAVLPQTEDYVLTVSTPNAAGAVTYELQITIE